MAVLPFISTAAVYEAFVRQPLFSGKNLIIIPCFQKGFAFCMQCNNTGASLCRTVVLNCCGPEMPPFVKQGLKNRLSNALGSSELFKLSEKGDTYVYLYMFIKS